MTQIEIEDETRRRMIAELLADIGWILVGIAGLVGVMSLIFPGIFPRPWAYFVVIVWLIGLYCQVVAWWFAWIATRYRRGTRP